MNIYITPYNLLNYAGIRGDAREIKYGEDDADMLCARCCVQATVQAGNISDSSGSDTTTSLDQDGEEKKNERHRHGIYASNGKMRKKGKNGQVINEE